MSAAAIQAAKRKVRQFLGLGLDIERHALADPAGRHIALPKDVRVLAGLEHRSILTPLRDAPLRAKAAT